MTPAPFSGTGLLLSTYNLLWKAISPLTRNHRRLKEGHAQRTLSEIQLTKSDIWIHAASAGEAYIACELVDTLNKSCLCAILISTHTKQGLEVLTKHLSKSDLPHVTACYAPFDSPSLMDKAFALVDPRLLVLVELELWPGMLAAAKKRRVHIAVINGRLTPHSFKGYARAKRLLAPLAPDFISAISTGDAERLSDLFPETPVEIISNIKFDRIPLADAPKHNPPALFPGAEDRVIYLLASVREEEEGAVISMVNKILDLDKAALIAWFPRHMERVEPLCQRLDKEGLPHKKRSHCTNIPGTLPLLIWDRFGEMGEAFSMADAAFVGGSFAPLGGQNMLEPLASGLVPVMGPSYSNFSWVGDSLKSNELLLLCETPKDAATKLVQLASASGDRVKVLQRFQALMETHRGGTRTTCDHIQRLHNLGRQ